MKKKQNVIGIKYCGGCHAGYDRKAVLQEIQKKNSSHVYKPAIDGMEYDYLLVLCSCSARCADCRQYKVRKERIIIDHVPQEEELDKISFP